MSLLLEREYSMTTSRYEIRTIDDTVINCRSVVEYFTKDSPTFEWKREVLSFENFISFLWNRAILSTWG